MKKHPQLLAGSLSIFLGLSAAIARADVSGELLRPTPSAQTIVVPMKRFLPLAVLLLVPMAIVRSAEFAPHKPNILFILTDDLGYGDIGIFFQNQLRDKGDRSAPWHLTPQIDKMAAEGVQLPNYYCPAPVCAPSRASLLLGVHQGHANVRDNQFDKALEHNHNLATVLKAAGYATGAIGKWGLQGGPGEKSPAAATAGLADWPAFPTKRGFDSYFGYVRHVDGHWHYPKEDKRQVWDNERDISADLDGCYTTDLFTARAKKWIVDQHNERPQQPFFLYLAYDTPHAKLQLPPSPYPAGGGLKGGLQWLGKPGAMINAANGTSDGYTHPDYANATWDDDHNAATPEQPWPDVYRRFATDVRRIDDCLGDLLTLLRDLKIDGDTLVIFTSDNGPSQESYLKEPYEADFFHSFGPFDGIKRDCWEGGLRVGAIARWPGAIPAGRVCKEPCMAHDWLATFADAAGVPAPARTDGVSLLPALLGTGAQPPSRIYTEYSVNGKTPSYGAFLPEHRGRVRKQMQALRLGDFMGVRYNVESHSDPFEIYNIVTDPQEAHDLGASPGFAALQQEMHDTVLRVRRPDPTAPRPYDAEFVPAMQVKTPEPGVEWRAYEIATPWIAKVDAMNPSARGQQPTLDLSHAPQAKDFSMLFTGFINVPADGDYTFAVKTETGALLRIHEATVLDDERAFSGSGEATGAIRLQKGAHPFRLYYRHHGTGTPAMTLRWSQSGASLEDVPAAVFSHDSIAAASPQ